MGNIIEILIILENGNVVENLKRSIMGITIGIITNFSVFDMDYATLTEVT